MADSNLGPKLVGLRNLQASLDQHRLGQPATTACKTRGRVAFDLQRWLNPFRRLRVRSRVLRRAAWPSHHDQIERRMIAAMFHSLGETKCSGDFVASLLKYHLAREQQ